MDDPVRLARSSKQIGQIIRRERRAKGLTQQGLAARVCVRQATISSVEAGEGGTKLSTLFHILAVLELELTVAPRGSGPAIEDIF